MKELVGILLTVFVIAMLASAGVGLAEQVIHAVAHGVYHVVAEFAEIAEHVASEAADGV